MSTKYSLLLSEMLLKPEPKHEVSKAFGDPKTIRQHLIRLCNQLHLPYDVVRVGKNPEDATVWVITLLKA